MSPSWSRSVNAGVENPPTAMLLKVLVRSAYVREVLARVTVKALPLSTVPPVVVRRSRPVLAWAGTRNDTCVPEMGVMLHGIPRTTTDRIFVRFVPVMVTKVLAPPLVGEKLLMVGVWA